jgi:hypothetical protein
MSEVKVIEVPEQGPPGNAGAQGLPGLDGNTIIYGGTAPSAAIGNDGDFYINTTTHYIYGPKSFGTWPAGTSLIGPQGATGPTGATGSTGSTGPTGLQGAQGGIRWNWSSTVTMADPGVGNLRFNNATLANVTQIAIDDQCAAPGNPDVSNFVLSWDDSSSGQKGYLVIQQSNDPATFLVFSITSITDNAGWTQINGNVAGSAGTFTNGTTLGVIFTRTGDVGTANIPDGSLTLAKLVVTTQGNLMFRASAGSGSWESGTIPNMSALTPVAGDFVLGSAAAGGAPRKVDVSNFIASALQPQGRLTLTTNTPVMLAAVAGATTVRYTPYRGLYVPIWNGTVLMPISTGGELTQLLTDTTKSPAAAAANSNYDMFVWLDSATPRCTRGPAWTSATARGTGAGTSELTRLIGGILTNAFAITNGPPANRGTYVGTVRTNAAGTIDWSAGGAAAGFMIANLTMWNNYNRIQQIAQSRDTEGVYSYNSDWRPAAGSATARINFVLGLEEDGFETKYQSRLTSTNIGGALCAIGLHYDSVAAAPPPLCNAVVYSSSSTFNDAGTPVCMLNSRNTQVITTTLGFHFIAAMEYSNGNIHNYNVSGDQSIYGIFQM